MYALWMPAMLNCTSQKCVYTYFTEGKYKKNMSRCQQQAQCSSVDYCIVPVLCTEYSKLRQREMFLSPSTRILNNVKRIIKSSKKYKKKQFGVKTVK